MNRDDCIAFSELLIVVDGGVGCLFVVGWCRLLAFPCLCMYVSICVYDCRGLPMQGSSPLASREVSWNVRLLWVAPERVVQVAIFIEEFLDH